MSLETLYVKGELTRDAAEPGVHPQAVYLKMDADLALAAADRLAHQSLYTSYHEAYWQARGGHDRCTVCRDPLRAGAIGSTPDFDSGDAGSSPAP